MTVKAFLMAMAASSMAVASVASAAAPVATPLTQKAVSQPASEEVNGENALAGGASWLIILLAVAAIGLGIAAGVSGDSTPNSP